jgi:hypothetical protein
MQSMQNLSNPARGVIKPIMNSIHAGTLGQFTVCTFGSSHEGGTVPTTMVDVRQSSRSFHGAECVRPRTRNASIFHSPVLSLKSPVSLASFRTFLSALEGSQWQLPTRISEDSRSF